MTKRNGAVDAEMLNAEEVNNFWSAKVLAMGQDVCEMPFRIAKRLPHLPPADLAAIADEFARLAAEWMAGHVIH